MANPLGYTTRPNVENFLHRTFPEVATDEFNGYILSAEAYVNNYLGYNGQTTASGILTETITREKTVGKIDQYGNLVVDVMKPPVNFDANGNPLVTLMEFNFGGVRVSMQLTDGSTNALNTLLEVSENRKKIIYPSIYFYPVISTVTPTAKMNLFSMRDVKFWVDTTYTGGYATTPYDIVLAMNYLVGDMLLHRDNPNFANRFQQGSYSVDYGNGIGKNEKTVDAVNRLLQPYVRYTW